VRLAIVTTHPIQYNAPWFKKFNEETRHSLKVFYTWSQVEAGLQFDPGFKRVVSWDIPLLEGYDYEFVRNVSHKPGSHHFFGIVNPNLIPSIEQWQPDAVLVIGWSFKSHLECLRYFNGKVPVLFRGDSTMLDEKGGLRKFLRQRFLRWVYSNVDYAFYVGENNRRYFLSCRVPETRLVFLPHAVDNSRFAEPDFLYRQKAAQWRMKLNIKESDFVILFVGKFEAKKNPEFVLQIANKLKRDTYKFVFVGDGLLRELIERASVDDKRIKIVDFQNQTEMPAIYRIGDLFILPSKGPNETWGLALNEAMASGIPVVASNRVGGAIDLIHDECGITVELTEIEKVLELAISLSGDKVQFSKFSDASRKSVQRFSFEEIVFRLNSVLDHLSDENK
jgi:glycosyltransferase involved in cell wall biosynthesis